MTTKAVIGAGSKIYRTDISPETAFGEITSISGIGATRPETEVTHLDSTGVERIGGLQDGNEVTLSGNYIRDAQVDQAIDDVATAQAPTRSYRVTIPTSPERTFSFDAVPLSWELGEITPSGAASFSLGLRISGGVTKS